MSVVDNFEEGLYSCVECGYCLYSSLEKFDCKFPFPAFREPVDKNNVKIEESFEFGQNRRLILCSNCKKQIGNLFDDGRSSGDNSGEADKRHCITPDCIKFVPMSLEEIEDTVKEYKSQFPYTKPLLVTIPVIAIAAFVYYKVKTQE